jgi:hypothetical protein
MMISELRQRNQNADNNGYTYMPAIPAHGKFAASLRSRRICWHVRHSQSLCVIEKKSEPLFSLKKEVDGLILLT